MLDEYLLNKISETEKEIADDMEEVSDFIFKNPEVGMEEYIASEFLSDKCSKAGFEVTRNFCGIDTAFIGKLTTGKGPTIAYMAEYDALPGFGPEGAAGHACGHNWIAATTLGAATVLSKLQDEFKGTVLLIGCPGMENKGCKVDFIKDNVFDDIDVVIQSHLEKRTSADCITEALDIIRFAFYGKPTHAAQHPEEGINALDAVRFTFSGIDTLKKYLKQDVNIYGVITEGGSNPTTIPGYAECIFCLRCYDRNYLDQIRHRVIKCAEGAALMTGTELEYGNFGNSLEGMCNNVVLSKLANQYLNFEGIEISPDYHNTRFYGSTDLGSVSHICPTMYIEVAMDLPKEEFTIHTDSALKYVNSKYAYTRLHQMIRIMAACGLEICNDNALLHNIKKEHRKAISRT